MLKISWPPKQLPLSTSGNWDHWCVWQVHCPFFEWSYEETCLMCLVTSGSASGFTSICPWLWPGEMLPAYWPVCKFDLILPVLFLAAFNVVTTITAYHLPLYQCVAIAFRILVLSVRFIVPSSVVQCYLVHWLNILLIAWPMMRVQHGFVFNIAWNLVWGLES